MELHTLTPATVLMRALGNIYSYYDHSPLMYQFMQISPTAKQSMKIKYQNMSEVAS